MTDSLTRRMLTAYRQTTEVPGFLSGFFTSPPRNFHNSEEVEIDILREDEDVAVAVHDITVGPRLNQASEYTNKRIKPPVFKEAGAVSAFELNKRQAGQDPFQDPDFQANAMMAAGDIARRLQAKVRRAVELEAAQVLQTGTCTLTDENGSAVYTIDFKPKTAHFANASGTWAAGANNPLADLEARADLIRQNGRAEAVRVIMGRAALTGFLANNDVRALLDNRRINLGGLQAPETRGAGGKFHGTISVGQNNLEIWSYTGQYKDPQTGVLTRYMADDKVIVMGDGRLDLTWGNIPLIGPPDSRVLPYLPRRVSDGERGMDMIMNAWLSDDRENLMVSVSARPLCIPTAIDTFGCMDVIL